MPKRKKKNNQYFTLDVDDAIEQYNNCDNIRERDRIYVKRIYPAFDKLSENLINTYKCPYIDSSFEDLKHELVSFLTEKLDKFSKESGKAYSYYTRTGINYLIVRNTKNYSIYDTTTNSKTPSEFLHSRRGRRSVASHTRDGSKHDSTRTPPRHTPQKWARLVPYSRRLLPRLHWRRQEDRDPLDSRIPTKTFTSLKPKT